MMFLSNVCGFQYKEWKQILIIQQVKVEKKLVLVLAKWTYTLRIVSLNVTKLPGKIINL